MADASRSGAQFVYIHVLPRAATRSGSNAFGKSNQGMYRTRVTPAISAQDPPIQRHRARQFGSRRAQGTMKNNPTMPVVYLMSVLRPTKKVPSNQRELVSMLGRAARGAIPSNTRVTIRASLWALPAASKSISGFQANTTNAESRARDFRPRMTRPSSHQTRATLMICRPFISSL